MEIRDATSSDIDEIVGLLKLSLGEGLMPKSPAYWKWKHLSNPFGPSPVLLAWEGNKLVGVRAFMRWLWHNDKKKYLAVRAVDTATHPDFQGKGIFKKLTLSLADRCIEQNYSFVFNTPNTESRPGYLKMGWVDAGKLPICIVLKRPVRTAMVLAGLSKSDPQQEMAGSSVEDVLSRTDLDELIKLNHNRLQKLHSVVSGGYLKWRYRDVPVAKYSAEPIVVDGQLHALIVFRTKIGKAGRELRITDVFLSSDAHRKTAIQSLRHILSKRPMELVTVSSDNAWLLSGVLKKSSASIGPIVTVRSLVGAPMADLEGFRSWAPSLGDLELF